MFLNLLDDKSVEELVYKYAKEFIWDEDVFVDLFTTGKITRDKDSIKFVYPKGNNSFYEMNISDFDLTSNFCSQISEKQLNKRHRAIMSVIFGDEYLKWFRREETNRIEDEYNKRESALYYQINDIEELTDNYDEEFFELKVKANKSCFQSLVEKLKFFVENKESMEGFNYFLDSLDEEERRELIEKYLEIFVPNVNASELLNKGTITKYKNSIKLTCPRCGKVEDVLNISDFTIMTSLPINLTQSELNQHHRAIMSVIFGQEYLDTFEQSEEIAYKSIRDNQIQEIDSDMLEIRAIVDKKNYNDKFNQFDEQSKTRNFWFALKRKAKDFAKFLTIEDDYPDDEM